MQDVPCDYDDVDDNLENNADFQGKQPKYRV